MPLKVDDAFFRFMIEIEINLNEDLSDNCKRFLPIKTVISEKFNYYLYVKFDVFHIIMS